MQNNVQCVTALCQIMPIPILINSFLLEYPARCQSTLLRSVESRMSSHKSQAAQHLTRLPMALKAANSLLPEPHSRAKGCPELAFGLQKSH